MQPPLVVRLVPSSRDGAEEEDPITMVPDEAAHVGTAKYSFITFTKPKENLEEAYRRRIRSQVLKNYHAKRRLAAGTKQTRKLAVLDSRDNEQRQLGRGRVLIALDARSQASYSSDLSPVTYLSAGLVDPFSVTPIDLSHVDRLYLQRYFDWISDQEAQNFNPLQISTRRYYVPEAMKDPILLNCILHTGSRGHGFADSGTDLGIKFGKQALIYKGRLIQAINQALEDNVRSVQDSTIAGILHLGWTELNEGNQDAYHLHAKAVQQLVELRGGLHTLGMHGWLADIISLVDRAMASVSTSQPYHRHDAPQRPLLLTNSLNSGFLAQPVLSNLSEELIGILDNLCAVSTYLSSNGDLPASGPVSWSSARASQNGLFTLEFNSAPTFIEFPDLQRCIIWTTECYISFVLCKPDPSGDIHKHLDSMEFLGIISRYLASEAHDEFLDLLLWISFMFCFSTDAQENIKSWLILSARITSSLGIGSWEQAASILKTFLWLEPKSEILGRATWLKMQDLSSI